MLQDWKKLQPRILLNTNTHTHTHARSAHPLCLTLFCTGALQPQAPQGRQGHRGLHVCAVEPVCCAHQRVQGEPALCCFVLSLLANVEG
eukprot:1157224-Pelagomonas_calceolata.AAC.12